MPTSFQLDEEENELQPEVATPSPAPEPPATSQEDPAQQAPETPKFQQGLSTISDPTVRSYLEGVLKERDEEEDVQDKSRFMAIAQTLGNLAQGSAINPITGCPATFTVHP